LKSEIEKAQGKGDRDGAAKLQEQLIHERKAIQAEFEEKRDQVRKARKK
jgi:hypothetical protein